MVVRGCACCCYCCYCCRCCCYCCCCCVSVCLCPKCIGVGVTAGEQSSWQAKHQPTSRHSHRDWSAGSFSWAPITDARWRRHRFRGTADCFNLVPCIPPPPLDRQGSVKKQKIKNIIVAPWWMFTLLKMAPGSLFDRASTSLWRCLRYLCPVEQTPRAQPS